MQKDMHQKTLNAISAQAPIEVMAERGYQTPLFGPLKPVGLEVDGIRPYAVVQLRPEDFLIR